MHAWSTDGANMTKTLQNKTRFVYIQAAGLKGWRRHVCIARLLRHSLAWGLPFIFAWLASAHAAETTQSLVSAKAPNVAFYYQDALPVDELQAFDAVVIDPARARLPDAGAAPHTFWFARLDLASWKRSASDAAGQAIMSGIQVLWDEGYRGFLLDDGVQADAGGSDDGMLALMDAIRDRYPEARLMLRNHIALARARAGSLYALVVDSLYHRPGGFAGMMGKTPDGLRDGLLGEIRQLQSEFALPVVAVDYCLAGDKACRRDLARRLQEDGVQPFVTAPGMGIVGTGRIEVMPRKILMVQALGRDQSLDQSVGVIGLSMPLSYLGYDVQYLDLNSKDLPANIGSDRYAGIVVALNQQAPKAGIWRQWLLARIREGMRVAVIGNFGFPLDSAALAALGLEGVPGKVPPGSVPQVVGKEPLMGFETLPSPDARDVVGVRAGSADASLLRLAFDSYVYDAAALTSWGGYTLTPYDVVFLDALREYRLVFQPIDFFRQALQLPEMPVPDVTSENGRRLMFTQVDGDGFVSRAEFSSAADEFSAEVLYRRILTKYPVPMTVSVIEGEIGPEGAYPELSPKLEPLARKIFALPNVEIASHSYSHPFFSWQIDNRTGKRIKPFHQTPEEAADPFSMDIPGYEFDLDREIFGSIDYINQRLAPPGKRVEAMLWTGDTEMRPLALRKAVQAGVLSINGGNTVITKARNSWTSIAPYGVAKDDDPDAYQVYAATMNENVYTNDWLGPFYGFKRVIETFAMTDEPIRFKALDIYYHFYSATKKASLAALEHVFDTAMKQPVFPVYTTEYIKRVLQWRRVSVARDGDRWIVRSGADLRQLRWPGAGVPELAGATGVMGYKPGPGGLYIHMGGDEASFRIASAGKQGLPYIQEASGFVRNFQRQGRGMQFELGGYYKPFVQFADMSGCVSSVADGSRGSGRSAGRVDVAGNAAKPVVYHSIRVHCE